MRQRPHQTLSLAATPLTGLWGTDAPCILDRSSPADRERYHQHLCMFKILGKMHHAPTEMTPSFRPNREVRNGSPLQWGLSSVSGKGSLRHPGRRGRAQFCRCGPHSHKQLCTVKGTLSLGPSEWVTESALTHHCRWFPLCTGRHFLSPPAQKQYFINAKRPHPRRQILPLSETQECSNPVSQELKYSTLLKVIHSAR